MSLSRFREALAFLGPLTVPELTRALGVGKRQVRRYIVASGYGINEDGMVDPKCRSRAKASPCLRAVRNLLADYEDGEVYSDWVVLMTGYQRRAVYEALRTLGYEAQRGRYATWVPRRMAA